VLLVIAGPRLRSQALLPDQARAPNIGARVVRSLVRALPAAPQGAKQVTVMPAVAHGALTEAGVTGEAGRRAEAQSAETAARLPAPGRDSAAARVPSPQVARPLRDGHLHRHAEGRALRTSEDRRRSPRGHDHRRPVSRSRHDQGRPRRSRPYQQRAPRALPPPCDGLVALRPRVPRTGRQDVPQADPARAGPAAGDAQSRPRHRLRPRVPAQGLRSPGARARRDHPPLPQVQLPHVPGTGTAFSGR
jgi:hypothetical protein